MSDSDVINDLSEPTESLSTDWCMASPISYLTEVISSQTSIVNLQNNAGIVLRTCKDLSTQVFGGLEVTSPVSDLGSPLLQVFLDLPL